jgi:uncharacterized C2H2 Zn-finger protein
LLLQVKVWYGDMKYLWIIFDWYSLFKKLGARKDYLKYPRGHVNAKRLWAVNRGPRWGWLMKKPRVENLVQTVPLMFFLYQTIIYIFLLTWGKVLIIVLACCKFDPEMYSKTIKTSAENLHWKPTV